MWCPFLSLFLPSFFSDFTTKKVDTHTFVSVYFHFTGAALCVPLFCFFHFSASKAEAGIVRLTPGGRTRSLSSPERTSTQVSGARFMWFTAAR